jgi:hypothetical protein
MQVLGLVMSAPEMGRTRARSPGVTVFDVSQSGGHSGTMRITISRESDISLRAQQVFQQFLDVTQDDPFERLRGMMWHDAAR